MTPARAHKELLDEAEAAAYLGLTNPKTLAVWRCTKRYDLPYVKYGRLVRYRRQDLEHFIESHLVPMR
ncbi:helix-turn-helix domain-containing protein [Acidovorax sp. HDW3]|uniref:helix-turn-helix domain-containing protein n=1 Tax=Acidovorax sp. HDW3 TaxID=2714923 RepID=UPI001F10E7A4|nr:helix-turn-helix domain-containing protein [Acidovorax sp. HDW3]